MFVTVVVCYKRVYIVVRGPLRSRVHFKSFVEDKYKTTSYDISRI